LVLDFQNNANGTADITIQAMDTGGLTVTDTLRVIVNAVNDAPTPVDDSIATTEDNPITAFNVLTNTTVDTDPDGDTLTVVGINGTTNLTGLSSSGAAVTLDASGNLQYDPTNAAALQSLATNQTTVDTFTYTVGDGALQAVATVSVTVTGINDAPLAVNDTATTDKNVTTNIDVLANDTDAENDSLTVIRINGLVANVGAPVSLTSGAIVTRNANNTVTYDPNGRFENLSSGQSTIDTFNYTIDDGNNEQATATVTVTIQGPNTPPNAVDDLPTTDEETSININVLANDSDPDGQAIQLVSINTTNTRGRALVSGNSVFYDPNNQFETLALGETATDTFTYIVADTQGGQSEATVTVTIRGVNDAPIGVNDGYNVIQGSQLTVTDVDGTATPTNILDDGLLVNDVDVDGDTLFASKLDDPLNGTVVVNSDGTFTYTHDGGSSTSDTFTYEVSDGNGGADTVTVTLTIVPRPPSVWQNPSNRFDVNADGFCTPIDALLVINRLNTVGPGELPNPAIPPNAPPPFYDVNGDGLITSNDVLQVINKLNTQVGQGEGESNAVNLLADGESNQAFAMPTNSSHYGAALWSHVTQPTAGSEASTEADNSQSSLVATVQSHQQAAAIDQLFSDGSIADADADLDEDFVDDFNAGVDALFSDPFDLGELDD